MTSLVSAIIPTYNRATLVQRAIESVLAQTHRKVEVIVIDDGSTDGTLDRVTDRYGSDDRVTCLATDRGGPAAARNAGLDAAAGSHVAFLDSDDEWLPWKIEFQLECLGRVPSAGMIWSDMAAVGPDGDLVARRHLRTLYRRHAEVDLPGLMDSLDVDAPGTGQATLWHGDIYRAMIGGNLVHTSTVVLTKARLQAVGRFDEHLVGTGEDFDFHLRTCRAGPVAFVDVPTMIWRVGAPDQLTRPDLMAQMARNNLTTIENAVADDDGRLSDGDRRLAVAAAHAWLGDELLESGLRTQAGPHLRAAMRGKRRTRVALLLAVSKLPAAIGNPLRRRLASITRPFRRRSAG